MSQNATTQVTVVGGGPVGLFLGGLLAKAGLAVAVLEARLNPSTHSRSIGIHPPALERLAGLGVADALIGRAVIIRRGRAFVGQRPLGTLDFSACPPPFSFVLALPQADTEAVLEARLCALDPGALRRGVRVVGLKAGDSGVRLETSAGPLQAEIVVGCDGKGSRVRAWAGIPYWGRDYPDHYLMGDLCDTTDLGADAGIYLTDVGLVESFPLPDGLRRWVVRLDAPCADPKPALLAALVAARTGEAPQAETCTMLSAFGVGHYLADRLVRGRVILCGDAAHVVSPIGGQGMNLGWLGAHDLAAALVAFVHRGDRTGLEAYDRHQRTRAHRAAVRARLNTRLGRPGPLHPLKTGAIAALLHSPLQGLLARLFTMRGL